MFKGFLATLAVIGFIILAVAQGWFVAFFGFFSMVFAAGTLGFWLLLLLLIVVEGLFVQYEQIKLSGFLLLLAFLILQFVTGIPIAQYVYHHVLYSIGYVIGFAILGSIYMVYMYRDMQENLSRRTDRLYEDFIRAKGLPKNSPIPVIFVKDWNSILRIHNIPIEPNFRKHKEQLFMWWAFWPIDGLVTITKNPIRFVWRFCWRNAERVLANIDQKTWAKHEARLVWPLTATNLSVNRGLKSANTVIYITGTGFTLDTEVFFGTKPVQSLKMISNKLLEITTPDYTSIPKTAFTFRGFENKLADVSIVLRNAAAGEEFIIRDMFTFE